MAQDSNTNPLANTHSLPKYLWEYEDMFSAKKVDIQQGHTPYDYPIKLEPGKILPHKPIYGLIVVKHGILKTYIKEALAKGWICPLASLASALILFVPRKNSTL
jgi:hypothetical protein